MILRGALLLLLALLPALAPAAAPVVHERGEFRFAVGPAPDFVVEQAVPDTWTADAGKDPAEPWRHWLLDQQVDRRDGRHVFYHAAAWQAGSQRLLGDAGKYSVSFSPEYQTLTLHALQVRRDGEWIDRLDADAVSLARRESGFENDLADGEVSALIVIDDVRVGDVVRIAFTIEGSNPIMDGHVANSFWLAAGAPLLYRHGRVLFDAATAARARVFGSDLQVRRRETRDGLEFSFTSAGAAAIRDTDDYPNWYRRYPSVEIARDESWADIVAWALPLYTVGDELPAELEARLPEWRALGDPYRIAGAVLRLVQEEVRYFGIEIADNTHRPNPPALVWSRRYGDCKDKALLTALLLRRLGLDAVPALVSTSWGKAIADGAPAASAFNHVIVRLRIDGRDYWLDPTLSAQRGDIRQLDLIDYGVALPVAAGVTAPVVVNPPERIHNALTIVERFAPAADGRSVDLRIETTYRGERAETIRRQLNGQSFAVMTEHWADYYRKRYGELAIATPASVDEDEEANVMKIVEHYTLADPWQRHGGTALLDTWPDALSGSLDLPGRVSREEPLRLERPETLRHEIRVELPEGWKLSSEPGTVSAAGGPIAYRRVLRQADGVVEMTHELKNDREYVDATQMRDYVAGLREAKAAAGMRLAFALPSALRDSERDRRLRDLLRGELDAPTGAR
ncbi:DUF3857 domain-containing protein [Arenimonas composti]|uniref:Transglutaminase-like domain-containing protein n=1 Tax=Arenimonas composti TR7-09 = DSM 18010 TaxID=1121013 RepID=A0A091BYC7_9GAMM|nr:DUF3857 domain-containing protein [Arenimonas composti]KFN49345.1 hypothetical protein P873_11270 [Arenimonas composti TR7-09 = DSM 18010]